MTKQITVHGGESTRWQEQLRDGAPEHFHTACARLLQSFSGKAHSILVGGTTGEGIGLGPRQYEVLLRAMQKACPPDIRILAGLLGRDNMIQNQIRMAHSLGIDQFVLGLNHTGDNQKRFDDAMSMVGSADRLWLYNMPTFDPASLEFITRCAEDLRVQGIKDSSK
jgi:dihydrodipicolinate synthase/N-acetylneuraminate lyase